MQYKILIAFLGTNGNKKKQHPIIIAERQEGQKREKALIVEPSENDSAQISSRVDCFACWCPPLKLEAAS